MSIKISTQLNKYAMKRTIWAIIIVLLSLQSHSQNIARIDSVLDNVDYDCISFMAYGIKLEDMEVPQYTRDRVIDILNGYLPPSRILERSFIPELVKERINKKAEEMCGKDTSRIMHVVDSITTAQIEKNIKEWKTDKFSKYLILAIGHWNIKEAEPILWENRNNKRYPQPETYLALAKLGNKKAIKIIWKKLNRKELRYYETGMYLRNKKMLLCMLDQWDDYKKMYAMDSNGDVKTTSDCNNFLWMSNCFSKLEKHEEWENILERYKRTMPGSLWEDIYLGDIYVGDLYLTEEGAMLTADARRKLKRELKRWIEENVLFE